MSDEVTIDLGRLPKAHSRHAGTVKAETELRILLLAWRKAHELTSAEYTYLVADAIACYAAVLVASERRNT